MTPLSIHIKLTSKLKYNKNHFIWKICLQHFKDPDEWDSQNSGLQAAECHLVKPVRKHCEEQGRDVRHEDHEDHGEEFDAVVDAHHLEGALNAPHCQSLNLPPRDIVYDVLFEPLVDDDDQDEESEGLPDGDELCETQAGMPDKEDLP